MNCTLCRDTPTAGYQCSRCGAYTAPTSNKGPQGVAENNSQISRALADLRSHRARRAAAQAAREAVDVAYAEQIAKHTEHTQTRGTHRRMMSRP